MKKKSIFKSKSAFAQALVAIAGAVGTIFPEAGAFIQANANTILLASGVVGVALRYITKDSVTLFGSDSG